MANVELESRINAIDVNLEGLRNASRRQHEETNTQLGILSKLREELDLERTRVRKLEMQVEQVQEFINKNASNIRY